MTFTEHELRLLFEESELFYEAMFSGKMMIGKIDKDIRVKFEFVSTNISKHYDAMRATVINRTEGEIDTNLFLFKDIIGKKNGQDPYIWDEESCTGWYGFKPTYSDYEKITDTLHDYMSMFADENIGYQMRTL